jgi:hypothetical protein
VIDDTQTVGGVDHIEPQSLGGRPRALYRGVPSRPELTPADSIRRDGSLSQRDHVAYAFPPSAHGWLYRALPATHAPRPPAGDQWLHEIKQDGFRLMVRRDAAGVRLLTRNGHDWTSRFPQIAAASKRSSCSPSCSRLDESGTLLCDLLNRAPAKRHHIASSHKRDERYEPKDACQVPVKRT